MTKAVRVAAQLPASTAASEKSGSQEFLTIALFSGIGLFVALVAVMMGVQGAWF
ncbi:hypothetical protein [Bradyrhizobium sp.]|uniref:hypothetical protein n=1 Tax=Bradyrhizobium sp. TaxID=376 RepID=UPI0025B90665|nr:hypothetical protein [Bradyrhizobium sp.]